MSHLPHPGARSAGPLGGTDGARAGPTGGRPVHAGLAAAERAGRQPARARCSTGRRTRVAAADGSRRAGRAGNARVDGPTSRARCLASARGRADGTATRLGRRATGSRFRPARLCAAG